jgi:hypothetical protein
MSTLYISRYHPGSTTPPSYDVVDHPTSDEENCSFLYLHAPAEVSRDERFAYHVTTRNFFAWLLGVPLVGVDPVSALLDLKIRMDQWRDPGADNFGALFQYVEEQCYGDFESIEIEMGNRLEPDRLDKPTTGVMSYAKAPTLTKDHTARKEGEVSRRESLKHTLKWSLKRRTPRTHITSRNKQQEPAPPVPALPSALRSGSQTSLPESKSADPACGMGPVAPAQNEQASRRLSGLPCTQSVNKVPDVALKAEKKRRRVSWASNNLTPAENLAAARLELATARAVPNLDALVSPIGSESERPFGAAGPSKKKRPRRAPIITDPRTGEEICSCCGKPRKQRKPEIGPVFDSSSSTAVVNVDEPVQKTENRAQNVEETTQKVNEPVKKPTERTSSCTRPKRTRRGSLYCEIVIPTYGNGLFGPHTAVELEAEPIVSELPGSFAALSPESPISMPELVNSTSSSESPVSPDTENGSRGSSLDQGPDVMEDYNEPARGRTTARSATGRSSNYQLPVNIMNSDADASMLERLLTELEAAGLSEKADPKGKGKGRARRGSVVSVRKDEEGVPILEMEA